MNSIDKKIDSTYKNSKKVTESTVVNDQNNLNQNSLQNRLDQENEAIEQNSKSVELLEQDSRNPIKD